MAKQCLRGERSDNFLRLHQSEAINLLKMKLQRMKKKFGGGGADKNVGGGGDKNVYFLALPSILLRRRYISYNLQLFREHALDTRS